MLDSLTKFDRIAVTGCWRSGTKIAAMVIAADCGMTYHNEYEFRLRNLDQFKAIWALPGKHVVQCPFLLMNLKETVAPPPSGVVYVVRDPVAIADSLVRAHMGRMVIRAMTVRHGFKTEDLIPADLDMAIINAAPEASRAGLIAQRMTYIHAAAVQLANIRLQFWHDNKATLGVPTFEVQYPADIQHSPLYVADRTGWTPQQTSVEKT